MAFLFKFLYAFGIDKRTLEPRRVLFFLFYYGVGAFVTFVVVATVLLTLDTYGFHFARNFIYHRLGDRVLFAMEGLLF